MNNLPRCPFNHAHPSRSENDYCWWLLARKKKGEIQDFSYIHSVPLYLTSGKNKKVWKYWKADFGVLENDGTVSVHESKGWNRSDDSFRLKLNICMRNHPKLKVYVNKVLVKFTPTGRIFFPRKTKWSFKKREVQK